MEREAKRKRRRRREEFGPQFPLARGRTRGAPWAGTHHTQMDCRQF